MKNVYKILLCATVLSFSLSLLGRRLRRPLKMDKCEQYYRRAMRTTNMSHRMRYLKDAMPHARNKDQKVKILVREAYTHHSLGNRELARQTIETGLKMSSMSSRCEDKLLAAKITLSYWHGIKDEKLVSTAQKLIYRRDYKSNYYLYNYISRHYLSKKQYQKSFDLYKTLERRATKDSRVYHYALIHQLSMAGRYLKKIYDVKIIIRKMERSNAPSDLLAWFYYHAGDAYRVSGDNTQAIKYFDKSIANHSQYYSSLSLIGKGNLLKKMNKPDEALESFTRAQNMAKHPHRHYAAAIAIADIHREKKNYDEAMHALEKGLKAINNKKYSDYKARLLLKIANINVECKKNKLAARQFRNIADNLSFSKGIRNSALKQFDRQSNSEAVEMLKKANELLKLRKYDLALKEAQKATANSKSKSNFYYTSILRQIYILLRMKNTSEALSLFNSIKTKDMQESSMGSYYSHKVMIYTALNQPEKVISAYKDYAKYSKAAEYSLAGYLQRIKRPKEALKTYQRIIKDEKAHKYYKIKAAMAVSKILLEQGEDKKAVKALASAFKLKGMSVNEKAKITLLMADIYIKYGHKDKALRLARNIKRNRKTSKAIRKQCVAFIWEAKNQESVVLMKKANSHISQGNLGESLLIIDNILKSCPSKGSWYRKALLKKIDILLRLRNYDKILDVVDRRTYKKMSPALKKSYRMKLAAMYQGMKKYDMAAKEYQKLIKMGHKGFIYQQANMLQTAKHLDDALKLYEQCFKEKVNIYNVALKMAEIYATQKDNQKAMDILKKAYDESSTHSSIKFLILYEIAVLYKKQGKKDEAKSNLQAIITNDLAPENYKKMAQEKLKEI